MWQCTPESLSLLSLTTLPLISLSFALHSLRIGHSILSLSSALPLFPLSPSSSPAPSSAARLLPPKVSLRVCEYAEHLSQVRIVRPLSFLSSHLLFESLSSRLSLRRMYSGHQWTVNQDHSKWGCGARGQPQVVCIGGVDSFPHLTA